MEENNNEFFNFDASRAIFIYKDHIDKPMYCYWLNRKVKHTHIVNYINVKHRPGNEEIPYINTLILIKFDKSFKTSNKYYFDYNSDNPKIIIIKDVEYFNEHKKYLSAIDDYTNILNKNIVSNIHLFKNTKTMLKRYIEFVNEISIIEEMFRDKICSEEKFTLEWLLYCRVKLLNEMSIKKIDIHIPQFIIDEFRLEPTYYLFILYLIKNLITWKKNSHIFSTLKNNI